MKRVLITEDDALMAEIYRDSFEREGFSAEIAADGAIAIQRLNGNPPDVVLLDLMMPKFNGVEVLKYIRSKEALRKLPVIVMSNALASVIGQQAAAAGATRMFAKNGCGPKRLIKEVREVLEASSPKKEEKAEDENTSTTSGKSKSLVELRKEATGGMPQRLQELRDSLQALAKGDGPAEEELLLRVHRAIHQLAGMVSFAGFTTMAQVACALEALIKELYSKPGSINASNLHTAGQALEVLTELSEHTGKPVDEGMLSPLILVVDDEAVSREITCTALEQARLRAMNVDDPVLAVRLANENRFDLILMDIQMPGMNGFEACKRIHATRLNAKTPIVFVTSLNDLGTRSLSASSGGADFIAKPVMLIELAVKALTHLLRNTVLAAPVNGSAARAAAKS